MFSSVADGMTGKGKSDSWLNEHSGDNHGVM